LQPGNKAADTKMVLPAKSAPASVVWPAVFILVICFALRCGVLATLYDGDMELFVYMGKLAGQGGRIGIELIDNKLPTVSLVMWPLHAIIGAWWPGYAWVGIGGAVLAVIALARAAGEVNRSSLWPTAVMAAVWTSFPLAVFSAFKLEHVTLPMSALAAWAFVRCWQTRSLGSAVLIGFFAGLGALAKPNALAVLVAAIGATLFWSSVPWRERFKLIAGMLAGCAVPLSGAVVYLVASGAIVALPGVYQQIRSYNQNSVWQPDAVMFKVLTVGFLIALPLFLRIVGERKRREASPADSGVLLRFAIGWFLIEAAGIAMQGRMYGYHFLPITAPAALLFGLIPRRAMGLSVIGSALPVLIASFFWVFSATLATQRPADRLAAIHYVKTHAAAGDSVWMDEYARLLVESDLKAGSRVPLTFIFSNDDAAPQRFGGMMLSDFSQRKPRWIVLPSDVMGRAEMLRSRRIEYVERPTRGEAFVREWATIKAAVDAEYTPVATFGEHQVVERRDALAAAALDR
jgi:hypothetical protein